MKEGVYCSSSIQNATWLDDAPIACIISAGTQRAIRLDRQIMKRVSNSARSLDRTPSKLQRLLAHRIVNYIRDNNLSKGDHLTELALAQKLQVSRTPIKGALDYLTSLDVVAPCGPRLGFRVRAGAGVVAKLSTEAVQSDEDEVYVRIAEDYVRQAIPEEFSEADLMRQYGVSRGLLTRVLQRMTREGVTERKAGYGWRFAPLLRPDGRAEEQSYRFRLAIEPAALLEPGFSLDRAWAARCRRDHEAILAMRPERISMIQFFEINADFHETLAACSGNPFFQQAAKSQYRLRRFLTYSRTYRLERIAASCKRHLAILSAVESGDQELAALQMRLHLQVAAKPTVPASGAKPTAAGPQSAGGNGKFR
jgi:DNA-binding GntR family transcriptional regulator